MNGRGGGAGLVNGRRSDLNLSPNRNDHMNLHNVSFNSLLLILQ